MLTDMRALQRTILTVALIMVTVTAACGRYPRDPDSSLESIEGGVVRIGITESPPWVRRQGDEASGIEVDLLTRFAENHDARIEWHWGTESENLEALRHHQLDVVAGGLTHSSPWRDHVAFTGPFVVETIHVGWRGQPGPTVKGMTIVATVPSPVARRLAAAGADVRLEADVLSGDTPAHAVVVAPKWELVAHGYETDARWGTAPLRHVFAVPRGENALLGALERSTLGQDEAIVERLARSAGRR